MTYMDQGVLNVIVLVVGISFLLVFTAVLLSGTRKPTRKSPRVFPAWIRCPMWCGDYVCTIHGVHVYDCECPDLEEWGDVDPYSEGGQSTEVWGMTDEEYERQMEGYPEEDF